MHHYDAMREDFMLRVAVVDDEEEVRDALVSMLSRFSEDDSVDLAVSVYTDGRSFIESGAVEDIVLLDIEMGEVNGMDAARILRKAGVASEIIFVTNMAQYAIKGYEVGAIDFVVKPVRYTSFALKFRRAVEAASRKRSSRISVETRDGIRYVDTSDIIYVEVKGHKLIYHTQRGAFEAWGTMKSVCAMLESFGFALCNACYLVNLSRVIAVAQDVVTVEGGDELKMSRGRKRSFMDALTRPMGG